MFAWNNDAHNYSNDKIEHLSINTLSSSQSREGPVSLLPALVPSLRAASIHLSFQLFSGDESAPRAPSPTPAESPLAERSVEDIMN